MQSLLARTNDAGSRSTFAKRSVESKCSLMMLASQPLSIDSCAVALQNRVSGKEESMSRSKPDKARVIWSSKSQTFSTRRSDL